MKPTSPLIAQVKRVIDQSPRNDWTSDSVRAAIEHKIQSVYMLNPEKAPRMPSLSRIRNALKDLSALGDIAVTTHQEGRLRYNTYERIIPEPTVVERGIGTLLFVGVICFLIGLAI